MATVNGMNSDDIDLIEFQTTTTIKELQKYQPNADVLETASAMIFKLLKGMEFKGHNPEGKPWEIKGIRKQDSTDICAELTKESLDAFFSKDMKQDLQFYIACSEDDPSHPGNLYTKQEIYEFLFREEYIRFNWNFANMISVYAKSL